MENKLLEKYYESIVEYNKVHMLTGFKNKDDIYNYLFLDSIKSFQDIDLKNKKLLDVGTGAGIPGIVLKINNPSLELFLMESLGKRIKFLKTLDFINFTLYHQRAEIINKKLIEQFDIVTCRALYNLKISLEILVQYVKVNGLIVLIKGKSVDPEIKENKDFIIKLNLELIKINTHEINSLITKVLVFKKIKKTTKTYPRVFSKIKNGD